MKRSIWFVIAGMVAGFLSGLIAPHVYGIRGAILGGALAGGLLACDACRKKKGELPVAIALAVAAAVSLVTFLLLCGWDAALPCLPDKLIADTSGMPPTTWHNALTCFLISSGVLLYCKNHSAACFFLIPLLSVVPRAVALEQQMRSGELPMGFLAISLFCAVVGLLPFLLLWGGVARLFGFLRKDDGAFSAHDRQRIDMT